MSDLIKDIFSQTGLTKFQLYASMFIIIFITVSYIDYIYDDDDDDDDCPRDKMDNAIKKIIKMKERAITKRMVESSKDGLMRGCIAGCISGGITGGITSAVVFGIANPFILYINEKK